MRWQATGVLRGHPAWLGALGVFAFSALVSYAVAASRADAEREREVMASVIRPLELDSAATPDAQPAPPAALSDSGVSAEVREPAEPAAHASLAVDPVAVGAGVPTAAPIGPEPAPTLRVIHGRVTRGGTVGAALAGLDVAPAVVHRVSRAMRPVFDFRRARSGDQFTLILGNDGEVSSFAYHRGRSIVYRLDRSADGLVARAEDVPLERRVLQLAGIVNRSVFEAITSLGERPELVDVFADVFVWDIDFSTQTRPGDEFRMVYEKFYDEDGFVRYGRVLAAEYSTPSRDFVALYYEDEEGYGDYFTPDGNSVRRTFLRAPVNYSRISSRYSKSRLHPILKVRRPHEGIDYAAPTGTPVWAVADGSVIFKGWSGGFGRLVKVRHNNGYISYYGHLRSFGKGLDVGARVRQKQVIGRVGQTGLATGPHLDYRVRVNGRFVDPLKLRFPKGEPVPVRERDRFNEIKEVRLAELREAQPQVVLEAAM